MTLPLRIELEPHPIERAAADVAVVTFFRDERPLAGSAGRADWRLCGRLSELLAAGGATGEAGEALLLGPNPGLAAPLLLALGQGSRRPLGSKECLAIGRDAALRSLGLGARCVALPLPEANVAGLGLKRRAEAVVAGAAQAAARLGRPLRLRLLASAGEAASLAELLPLLNPRPLPEDVVLELPPAGPARRALPGRSPVPPARVK